MRATKIFSLITTLALLAGMWADTSGGAAVYAQTLGARGDKIGADLRQKVRSATSGERVRVIVQPAGPWGATLDAVIGGSDGSVLRSFKNLNARAVELPAAAVDALSQRSDIGYVSLDREVNLLGHVSLTTGADAARAMGGGSNGYDGTGVGIAVLDSGIDPRHVVFNDASSKTRIVYNQDFTGEGRTDDPYGHGTHVAALAAGNGNVAQGAYQGVAPNARLVNLRVLNSQGRGTVSAVLAALDWVLTNRANPSYNVRVVNMSLGTAAVDSYKNDPLCQAVRRLVNAGVVVAAAAGNDGKNSLGAKIYGAIHSPGNEPSAITVGATNTFGTDARDDDGVTTYSSRGPTRSFRTDANGTKHYDNIVKPDLVAPGNKLIAAESPANYLVASTPSLDANVSPSDIREQMFMSGTSMATPLVAGGAALLLQANPSLTPNLVKALLMYTAQPLAGFNNFEQGAGQLNLEGAMRVATLVRADLTASTPVGSPLLTTATPPQAQTTIAGHAFQWAQGLILDYAFVTGTNLVTQYQGVYGVGTLLGDATIDGLTSVSLDPAMTGSGVIMSDNILTSYGVTLSEGAIFCGTGVLLQDGTMLASGAMLSDGAMASDGAMHSDGAMVSDGAMHSDSLTILAYGDNTGAMMVVLDGAPGALAATAVSKSQINLTWADNTTIESGFRVMRSSDGKAFREVATVPANTPRYSEAGLALNTKYYYRVYAYNGYGSTAYSNTANAVTLRK